MTFRKEFVFSQKIYLQILQGQHQQKQVKKMNLQKMENLKRSLNVGINHALGHEPGKMRRKTFLLLIELRYTQFYSFSCIVCKYTDIVLPTDQGVIMLVDSDT